MKCAFLLILIIIINSTIYTNQENTYIMENPENYFFTDFADYKDYSQSGLINDFDHSFQDFSNYKTVSISTEYPINKSDNLMISPLQNEIYPFNKIEQTIPNDSYSTNYNESFKSSNSNLIIIKKDCSKECLNCSNGNCKRCKRGKLLYNGNCYDNCPDYLFADNLEMTCKEEKDNPIYIKAYTISKCVNSCGKNFFDCSCNSSCIRNGTCCSDFRFCQVIQENHTSKTKIPNCMFADEDDSICLQCKENFYYFNNQCLVKCPEVQNNLRSLNTKYSTHMEDQSDKTKLKDNCSKKIIPYQENKICKEINLECNNDGNIQNYHCERCENGKCLRCKNGFYLFENKCLKSCPVGMRANRIDFTCETKSSFSFYWIFPSKFSCKDKCGVNSLESDCSCTHSCLRRGNCCDDFEKECKEEMAKEVCKLCDDCIFGSCLKCKENSFLNTLRKNECECQKDFHYDVQEDICISNRVDQGIKIDENYQTNKKNLIVLINDTKKVEKKKEQKITYKSVIYQNKSDPFINLNKNSTNLMKKEYVYAEEIKKDVNHIETFKTCIDVKNLKKPSKNYDGPNKVTNSSENNNNDFIIHNSTKDYYNQNFEKTTERDKNTLNPILTINLDAKNKGILDFVSNQNEFDTHKTKKNAKDEFEKTNFSKNTTDTDKLMVIAEEKSILNSTHHDLNDIINKSLSEELLNSFKKLFSNFASDKEKSKQTLNLYLNGNISFNLLTGNTNPQIIYKNIYNTDSYNTNKTILYNVNSKNKLNNSMTKPSKELNCGSFLEKANAFKYKKNAAINNTNISENILENNEDKKDNLSKSNIGTREKFEPGEVINDDSEIEYNEKDDNNNSANENLDKNESSNFLRAKNKKVMKFTEEKMQKILEDEELKSFLKKKVEKDNKWRKDKSDRIDVDHFEKLESHGGFLGDINPKFNQTLEKHMTYNSPY